MGLTQPAVSDQVRKLEIEYDTRLFIRHKKQTTLTIQGEKLLEITHRLFEVEQQARDYLSESKIAQIGKLEIIVDSARHILHILGPFKQRYPNVNIAVRVGNSQQILDELQNYTADIGVLGEIPKANDFDVINLGTTKIIAFAPRSANNVLPPEMSMQELAQNPLVLREAGSRTRAKFEQQAQAMGIRIKGQIEAEGRDAVREIVAGGGGIGIVSTAEFSEDPRLKKIRISDASIFMDEALICLKERSGSNLIRSFMKMAREISDDKFNIPV